MWPLHRLTNWRARSQTTSLYVADTGGLTWMVLVLWERPVRTDLWYGYCSNLPCNVDQAAQGQADAARKRDVRRVLEGTIMVHTLRAGRRKKALRHRATNLGMIIRLHSA